MSTRRLTAALALLLALPLAACGAEKGSAQAVAGSPAATPSVEQSPESPKSPEEFLDLAEAAMTGESGWTFSVTGREGLTLQGQRSAATYRATVHRGTDPEALHSEGVSTNSKGTKKSEEIYVVDGTAYVKEDGAAWKHAPASDPEMENKTEDPVAAVAEFRTYAKAAGGGDVKLTKARGTVELRVTGGRRKLAAVKDRAWAKKARREFAPTAEQLRDAGVPVNDDQLTLSRLQEVLVLDATTYRVRSHRYELEILVPYAGGGDIAYEQDVREENRGAYAGRIELPGDVGA
ncbi:MULTISPECIES: hypothetical protein [unclassified Streptomyces]|uniref:hypothetical protein n=1 Tax=unclassified Streptomyces TaxID=2593676 RepID=UPI00035C7E2C|nr:MULTISPECIES: hypothetical protein [unclassified Streptomyces]MYX39187.1 hypothetical protein [Streptomyces sp. SID8377]